MQKVGSILSLRTTPIGLPRTRLLLIPIALAAGIVTIDLVFAQTIEPQVRIALATAFVLVSLATTRPVSRATIGLTLKPVQGWKPWAWAIFVLIASLSVVCLALFASVQYGGNPLALRSMFGSRHDAMTFMVTACLVAPIVEEAIYRVVLCSATKSLLGPWAAVVLSGLLFAFLHVRYGNPSVDNVLAGFILSWAFLKSGSVAVPLLFHSLGNAVIMALHASIIGTP
jgi:membrane protease YdiL (CAAX protease family)